MFAKLFGTEEDQVLVVVLPSRTHEGGSEIHVYTEGEDTICLMKKITWKYEEAAGVLQGLTEERARALYAAIEEEHRWAHPEQGH